MGHRERDRLGENQKKWNKGDLPEKAGGGEKSSFKTCVASCEKQNKSKVNLSLAC